MRGSASCHLPTPHRNRPLLEILTFLFEFEKETGTNSKLKPSNNTDVEFQFKMIGHLSTIFHPPNIPWGAVVLLYSSRPSLRLVNRCLSNLSTYTGETINPFVDITALDWVHTMFELTTKELCRWKRVITLLIHPDKAPKPTPPKAFEMRNLLTVSWNSYVVSKEPTTIFIPDPPSPDKPSPYTDDESITEEDVEYTDYDDDYEYISDEDVDGSSDMEDEYTDSDEDRSLGTRTLGYVSERYGLVVFTQPRSGCIAVYTQNHYKVSRNTSKLVELEVILSHWTNSLNVYSDWDNDALFEVKLTVSRAGHQAKAQFKRPVSFSARPMDWMHRPALPTIKNSCWIISTCILFSCLRGFMSKCDASGDVKIDKSNSGPMLFKLISLIATETTSIENRTKKISKPTKKQMEELMKALIVSCVDGKRRDVSTGVNDSRCLIGSLLNSPQVTSMNLNSLIGTATSFWTCPTETDIQFSEVTMHPHLYTVNGNDEAQGISSLANLDIGEVNNRRCATCNNHPIIARTVWTGLPPDELLVSIYETICTSIDLDPGTIELFFRTTAASKEIKVARYAISAMLIGSESHQLVAMAAPGITNIPHYWDIIDPSSSVWPPRQAITKFIPEGVIACMVLRRSDAPDIDIPGFPTPVINKWCVSQFAQTLIIIADTDSILYSEWNLAESEDTPYAFITTNTCLADHGGCDCESVGPRADGDVIPGRCTSILIHLIYLDSEITLSSRKYISLIDAAERQNLLSCRISEMQIKKVGECNEQGSRPVTLDCFSVPDLKEHHQHRGKSQYVLKRAKLSLRSIDNKGGKPIHHYRVDTLAMIPIYHRTSSLPDYVRRNPKYNNRSIPRGCFTMEASSVEDNRDVACHIFQKADSDIQSIVNPSLNNAL
jgi:hypothetical protein